MVKKSPTAKKEVPYLTSTPDEAARLIEDHIKKGQELIRMNEPAYDWDRLETSKNEYGKWNLYNVALLEKLFTTDSIAKEYNFLGAAVIANVYGGRPSFAQELEDLKDRIKKRVNRLESIVERLPLYNVQTNSPMQVNQQLESKNAPVVDNSKVFIVHGHDTSVKLDVARSLEKLGLTPIILHKQASLGQTIIEKLENNSDVGFAIVLLTPDDLGKAKADSNLSPRARQNVLIELGYFVAKLGRDKVCPLYVKGVEIPSDFSGVVFVQIDGAGYWRFELCKELQAAGYKVSADNLL
jgi:predicted nucleotide-binding protein